VARNKKAIVQLGPAALRETQHEPRLQGALPLFVEEAKQREGLPDDTILAVEDQWVRWLG
jgi:hypothetical protein